MNNVPFPQANSLDKVLSFMYLLENSYSKDELANLMDVHLRQVDYYYNALRYLGLVVKNTKNFYLTEKASQMNRMSYHVKTKTLVQIIKTHPVLSKIIALESLDNKTIMECFTIKPSLITAKRRLSTMVAWKRWINEIEKKFR